MKSKYVSKTVYVRKLDVKTDYNKVCKDCGEEKDISLFAKTNNIMCGYKPNCKDCSNKEIRARRAVLKSGEALFYFCKQYHKADIITNPEKFVKINCNLCRNDFFPSNKTIIYCTPCREIRERVRWSLTQNFSEWPNSNQEHRKKGEKLSDKEVDIISNNFVATTICSYCDGDFTEEKEFLKSFDHIVPRAKGGIAEPSNIAVICMRCNHSKRSLLMDEWIEHCGLVWKKLGKK